MMGGARSIERPPDGEWAANQDSPQWQGLVAWWPAYAWGNGGGLALRDMGPYGLFHATQGGSYAWRGDGLFARGFDFSANTSHAAASDHALLEPGSGAFTVTAWVRWPSTPGNHGIAGKWSTSGSNRCWDFATHWANTDDFYIAFSSDGASLYSAGETLGAGLAAGNLYHVAFVHVPGGNPLVYVDAVGPKTWQWDNGSAAPASLPNTNAPFDLSRWANGGIYIYDLRYYNIALSQAALLEHVNPQTIFDLVWDPKFIQSVLLPPAGGSPQTISPSGIATTETFGSAAAQPGAVTVSPSGISSEEAIGAPQANLAVAPSGVASAEAAGAPALHLTVLSSGIASAEALGTPSLQFTISPSGIAGAEAFGAHVISVGGITIAVTGIASADSFGSLAIQPGAVAIAPAGITSGEAFGAPAIALYVITSSISSAETFGTALLVLIVLPSGAISGEAFGSLTMQPGAVTILPSGIASAEVFGASELLFTSLQIVTAAGIASAEAFGASVVLKLILSADAEHTYIVPADDLIFVVAADDLTYVVPGDDFIYVAKR